MMLILLLSIALVESKPGKTAIVKESDIEVKSDWRSISNNHAAPQTYATFTIYFLPVVLFYTDIESRFFKKVKERLASQFQELNPYATGTTNVELTLPNDFDPTEANVKVTFSGILEDNSKPLDVKTLKQAITKSAEAELDTLEYVDESMLDTIKPVISTNHQPLPSQSAITNTLQMAEAVLHGDFEPTMAVDYGCAGKGNFDPFAPIIGKQTDNTDKAFFKWKKCIRCATNNGRKQLQPYEYDKSNDVCAEAYRELCECDRELMNFLKTAPAAPSAKAECEKGSGAGNLECCNWNDFRWAAYNPDRSCCGADGVKERGNC